MYTYFFVFKILQNVETTTTTTTTTRTRTTTYILIDRDALGEKHLSTYFITDESNLNI